MSMLNDGRHFVIAILATAALDATACGPFFPNRLLTDADTELLAVPIGIFGNELDRLTGRVSDDSQQGGDSIARTANADLADLEDALSTTALSAAERGRILDQYRTVRDFLSRRAAETGAIPQPRTDGNAGAPPDALQPQAAPTPPSGLPAEFSLYARGALRLHVGDTAGARELWNSLLALPPDARRYRSTWAAHMLARTTPDTAPDDVVTACRLVRTLAEDDFRDSLGLAADSVGWEARAELQRGDIRRAMHLYAGQYKTGDTSVATSLAHCAASAVRRGQEAMNPLVRDPLARGILAAWIVSSNSHAWEGPDRGIQRATALLTALESAGVTGVDGADRLAWVAYRAGRFDEAGRWIERAAPDSRIGRWLHSKLLLRRGRVQEAADILHALVNERPATASVLDFTFLNATGGALIDLRWEPETNRIRGELGVLRLGEQRFADALDLLLHGGYWDDAAYIAERVMTTDDLRAAVDGAWPDPPDRRQVAAGRAAESFFSPPPPGVRLRHLLARRLVREGRGTEARPYFPPDWRERLDAYLAAQAEANEPSERPPAERAAALWSAARLLRRDGMELAGTELEPDWFIHGGLHERDGISFVRGGAGEGPRLARVTDAERRALAATGARPALRFHYRYVAADLAWEAAERMPEQDPRTAQVLWAAGGWLKYRDPVAADRFYKALVRRCGRTPLGELADSLRWFPTPAQAAEAGVIVEPQAARQAQ